MEWRALLFMSCCTILPSLVPSQGVGGIYDCPEPWIEFDTRCYKFELRAKSIQDAIDDCQTNGASLLSINFYEEHQFVADWLATYALQYRDWYTSGKRDTSGENKFLWEGDGTNIESYQFWLSDVSSQEGNRIVYGTVGGTWGWKIVREQEQNTGADILRPYICEISKSQIFKILEEDRGFSYGAEDTDPASIEFGPVFTEQPESVVYEDNPFKKYVTLLCVADGNPSTQYTWYKKKDLKRSPINPAADSRLTITNGKLTINQPSNTVDNADYDCVAENTYGAVKSQSAQIIFGYLNDFPKSQREPVIANAFDGAGIECSPPTHGYPYLLYSWYKGDLRNFIRPKLKPYTFISNNGKLYFSSVTTDDAGFYTCSVSSPLEYGQGKNSLPTELIVREAVGSEHEPQIVSEFPAIFPSSPLKGDNVRIECFAYGTATTTDKLIYKWAKIGGPLPLGHKVLDHDRVLFIPNVQVIHSGTYQCSVSRREGLTTQKRIELSVEAAPYFIIPLKNQHVDRGSELIWQALADGIPTVRYQWYRNGEPLVLEDLEDIDRNRYSIQKNILTIQDVHPDRDSGMYQLAATNTKGTTYSSAQLRVLSFAPTFIKYPLQQRQYATLRGNITIICQPESAPASEKTWQKNGRDLSVSEDPNSRIYVLPNGNLVIKNVRQDDQGLYTCTAVNLLGEAKSSGNLTILPTTTISQEPRPATVQVNKTAIFQCQASFNPTLDITYDWYHNDRKIEFIKIRVIGDEQYIMEEDYFERGTGINRGALYIYHTQYFHAGFYTCVALTVTEAITRTVKLDVIGPPFPPVGLQGSHVTKDSVRLSWKMGERADNGMPVTSYMIEGFDLKEGFWRKFKTNVRGEDMREKTTEVTGLSPYSNYKFRIRAENVYGMGDPSDESEIYTTAQAPPETYPMNVGRCVNKVGTLCIVWDPVPLAQQNGNGFGYLVNYKQSFIEDEDYTTERVQGADADQYVALVGQANYFKEYDISVRAFNNEGFGPPSPEITIRSAMGIPTGQATQLRVWQHNATALLAEWDPVKDSVELLKGRLEGYRINYWRECCETEEMAIFNQVQGQRDDGMIIGLYPDTYYEINVQVFNEAGYGPKTDPITQETLRSAPMEAPQEVHVYVEGDTSILVKWRGVSTGIEEEPLTGYRVRFWRQSENRYLAEDREAFKKTELKITDLAVDTYYELRIYGYSRGGDGLMSSPIIQFILGENCFVREDSPEKEYVYKCRGETDGASTRSSAHVVIVTILVLLIQCFLFHV